MILSEILRPDLFHVSYHVIATNDSSTGIGSFAIFWNKFSIHSFQLVSFSWASSFYASLTSSSLQCIITWRGISERSVCTIALHSPVQTSWHVQYSLIQLESPIHTLITCTWLQPSLAYLHVACSNPMTRFPAQKSTVKDHVSPSCWNCNIIKWTVKYSAFISANRGFIPASHCCFKLHCSDPEVDDDMGYKYPGDSKM